MFITVDHTPRTQRIGEGTFIVGNGESGEDVCVFAQVDKDVFKWINLDGNRQVDKEYMGVDIALGNVRFPDEADDWKILSIGDSFTVEIE